MLLLDRRWLLERDPLLIHFKVFMAWVIIYKTKVFLCIVSRHVHNNLIMHPLHNSKVCMNEIFNQNVNNRGCELVYKSINYIFIYVRPFEICLFCQFYSSTIDFPTNNRQNRKIDFTVQQSMTRHRFFKNSCIPCKNGLTDQI